jgi:hypothetical protein
MKTKNYCFLIILLLIFSLKSYAFQNKSGTISSLDIWSDTIHVIGNITIAQSGNLIINPGTYIEFQGFYFIKVNQNGKINAIGTISDSIKFIALNMTTKWNGIKFDNMTVSADSSIFQYCSFRYGNGAMNINKFNKVQVNNCNFSNNRYDLGGSYGNGGAIYADSSIIVINNSVFNKNYAGYGGSLYFSYSNVFINNTRLTANNIYWSGGGLYCDMTVLTMKNCLVDSNYHTNTGGGAGLYTRQSDVILIGCRFSNNIGNAIYSYNAGGKLKVENTIISNNENSEGAALECVGIELLVVNSTIVNNKTTSKTGGIYLYYCHPVQISNSILWNNAGMYPDLYFVNHIPTIQNCDIKDGNLLNIPSSQYINNVSVDPKFLSPSTTIGFSNDALGAQWDLISCSPCINAGDSSLVDSIWPVDYNNNLRIYNDTIDMGACEFQGTHTLMGGTKIVYVTPNGNGDGSSWINATANLQNAINTPQLCYNPIEVWVASGTYYPEIVGLTDPRTASFKLKDNVRIYGGFIGTEDSLNMRNWELNPTILNGDIGNPNDSIDNVYNVVYAANVNNTAILDGFVITKGCSAFASTNNGGGIYCTYASPVLNNLMIKKNIANGNGGGIYLNYSNATITNSVIYNNMTWGNAGGIYLNYSHAKIINSQIIDNYVLFGFNGGGIVANYSNPYLINSIIANNAIDGFNGGGMYCSDANPVIINSVFANNTCGGNIGGAGIYAYFNSHPEIFNSIFWNNLDPSGPNNFATPSNSATISFNVRSSLINGGNIYNIPAAQYVNNIDTLPRFLHPSLIIGRDDNVINADWRLFSCSPCINHGDTALFPEIINYDMAFLSRIFNDSIDIGPYEFQGNTSGLATKNIIYVKPTGNGNGTSWNDAIGNLQQAIDLPYGCYETSEIWAMYGTYLPDVSGLSNTKLASFNIRNNNHLYGGFAGIEDSLSQRDWFINKSILSGNVGSVTDSTDNSNNVVFISQQDTTTVDGFVINNGYSNEYYQGGGGIYCEYSTVKLNNLTITNNISEHRAGGIYAIKTIFDLRNSIISSNAADEATAVFLESSKMEIENCKILNNNSSSSGTGGIKVNSSKGKIVNCLINNNYGGKAGAIVSWQSNYAVINSTLANNKCVFSGPDGIYANDTLYLLNSILWESQYGGSTNQINFTNSNLIKIQNCDIKNGTNLNIPPQNYINNIDSDPMFRNPNGQIGNYPLANLSDWSLKSCSPCIETGYFDTAFVVTAIDMEGNPRVYNNGNVDIGAFEYQGVQKCIFINFVITNGVIPGADFYVWLNSNIFQITDSTGKCGFDYNSTGEDFLYQISYGGYLNFSDSIYNLMNDTTIYLTFNSIEESPRNSNFLIYPNPISNELNIEFKGNNEKVNFEILNSIGQVVYKGNFVGKTIVQTKNFASGVYLIKLENNKTFQFKKVIKE